MHSKESDYWNGIESYQFQYPAKQVALKFIIDWNILKKYKNKWKSIDIHGKVHQFLIAKSQILVFESNFLSTSKKKASALIVSTVKLCSIKNVVKRKDKFTLHYHV